MKNNTIVTAEMVAEMVEEVERKLEIIRGLGVVMQDLQSSMDWRMNVNEDGTKSEPEEGSYYFYQYEAYKMARDAVGDIIRELA